MKGLARGSVAALFVLLTIPNVVLLWNGQQTAGFPWVIALTVIPIVLLAAWFALFARRPWLACLVLTPFAALVPLVTFYVGRYGNPINSALLDTLTTTNPGEASQFFGPWLWPLAVLTACGAAFALGAAWLAWRTRLAFRLSWRTRVATVVVACVCLLATAVSSFAAPRHLPLAAQAVMNVARDAQYGYPGVIGVAFAAWANDNARERIAASRLARFRFHPQRLSETKRRHVYVLVIGESSRRNHWQLFGYARHTNPQLSRIDHLVRVTHMVTPWPLTLGAIPAMLTRKPATMPVARTFKEASIVELMRGAGYQTWWISNQARAGRSNVPITLYADEANHQRWLSLQRYDIDLDRSLQTVLRTTTGNLFVVLHMRGSHKGYDYRYPRPFDHFRPTLSDGNRYDPTPQQVVDSYDNTILYTDHVLASIIRTLQRSNTVTALWYQSDHGETLPTATCDKDGHGLGYRYEFPVPALFWYSAAYAMAYPQKIAAIERNAPMRTSAADTFATLADMADVRFPGQDLMRSLFDPAWHYRPRMVNPVWQQAGDAVDYDTAVLGNGCELVRAPKRPSTSIRVASPPAIRQQATSRTGHDKDAVSIRRAIEHQ